MYVCLQCGPSVVDLEGFNGGCIEIKFLEGSATLLFLSQGTSLPGHRVN